MITTCLIAGETGSGEDEEELACSVNAPAPTDASTAMTTAANTSLRRMQILPLPRIDTAAPLKLGAGGLTTGQVGSSGSGGCVASHARSHAGTAVDVIPTGCTRLWTYWNESE